MAILDIVLYPDDVLTSAGADVPGVDDGLRQFLDDMADTMYQARGVGLAANQVGDLRRVCVIDATEEGDERDEREGLLQLVNPRVVERSGEIKWEEGCLSFPELYENVMRSNWVKVAALNRDGEPIEVEGEGLLAVVLQHEIDHLDGVLFIDRVSRLKKTMALKRYRKILRRREAEEAQGEDPE